MRHGKSFNHLGRKTGHRRLMLANMASSLITHKRITTTLAKAKALRGYVEPLITKSKEDTTHSRRVVFSYLQDKEATAELFREVGVKVADRPGGYTRIIKLAPRLGDNAELAMIELVDFNELLLTDKKEKKTTRRRRGAGTSKKADAPVVAAPVEAKAEETSVASEVEVQDDASVDAPSSDAASTSTDEASEEEKKD